MNENTSKIISLCDGVLSCKEIGEIVGVGRRYVEKVAKKYKLPQLRRGAQPHDKNHQFVSGRRIDRDGYVLVTSPSDHPHARQRTNREGKLIYEHRLVLEQKIGRYLLPGEAVDHSDGLTLHNSPLNLRLFENNGEHLKATISGLPKQISLSGRLNIKTRNHPAEDRILVDTHRRRRERGDVRLLQIIRAALLLGIDSPYLLGTRYFLRKAEILIPSRSNLELALAALYRRYEQDLAL